MKNDTKHEAQGLEVFTVPGRYLAVNRKNPGAQDVVLLSDATAVIDQQSAELAYFGEQELHLRSVIDQLRERVAELEREICYLMGEINGEKR